MQDASVRDSFYLKQSPGSGGWTLRVDTVGEEWHSLALTHLLRQAFHSLLHLSQVRLGLLSIPGQALLRSPLCVFPLTLCLGSRHLVRLGPDREGAQKDSGLHTAWDSPARDTPGAQVLLGRATRLSRDTSLRAGLAQGPPHASPSCLLGVSRDRDSEPAGKRMQGRPEGPGPTAKGCTCLFTAVPSMSPKRAAAQCPWADEQIYCGPSHSGTVLSHEKERSTDMCCMDGPQKCHAQ